MKVLYETCNPYLTVDNTRTTVDNSLITADTTNSTCYNDGTQYYEMELVSRIKLERGDDVSLILTREMTNKEIIISSYEWFYRKGLLVIQFMSDDVVDNGKYSILIKSLNSVVYEGKAINTLQDSQDYKYTKIINNKLYI